MTKNGGKSVALFRQKRQICQLSAFHGTFWGRAILKHIFKIKFVVYLENFSLVGGIRDEKMTKTVEKARRFSAKREIEGEIRLLWTFQLKIQYFW